MAWPLLVCSPTSQLSYWSTQALESGTTLTDAGASVIGCNKWVGVWSRTVPSTLREDRMTASVHISKQVGPLRSFYTSAGDLNAVQAIFLTWLASLTTHMSNQITSVECRSYIVRDDMEDTGPAVRITSIGTVGGVATSRMPDQVSSTVTWRTPSRRHWGRSYVPGIAASKFDTTYGRLTNATTDSFALASQTMVNSLIAAGYSMGVWSPTARSFLDVSEVRVDDVPDIQRRRRPKQRNYLKSYSS